MRRAGFAIFAAVLLLYLSFPTKNYYWDGIGFAQDIESDPDGPWFLHPNHLLYSPLGRTLWTTTSALGIESRALTVLRVLSSVTGAAAVAMLFLILLEVGSSGYVAACLAAAFAFSATWWKFATDANSYVPSTFLLMLCFWCLVRDKPQRVVLAGSLHAAAMLLHQLAFLFYPAAILALWLSGRSESRSSRWNRIGLYTLFAGTPVIAAYAAAFSVRHPEGDLGGFVRWVTSYSPDVSFSFTLWNNLATSIVGNIRLVLGGDLRLLQQQQSSISMGGAVMLAITLAIVVGRLLQNPPRFLPIQNGVRKILPILAAWFGVYAVFLVFWLPHNTFYRIFYLPAFFVAIAGLLGRTRTRFNRLALGIGGLFLLNFAFYIYPQAQLGANRGLQIAEEMSQLWKPGDIVYWDVYAADNRTIRYFNPQVEWKELWGRAWTNLIADSLQKTGSVWFDKIALNEFIRRDPEFAAWLPEHCRITESYEFPIGDRTIGFVRLEKLGPEGN